MNEQTNPLAEALTAIIKPIVESAIKEALSSHAEADRLLDAEEAAKLLSLSPDWLYRNAKKLPFTRKIGPKMLRFSYQGIQKYLQTKNFC